MDIDGVPSGFTLLHSFSGHMKGINRIAWSPNTHMLASSSNDCTIRLWDIQSGQLLRTFEGSTEYQSVTWSPDGRIIAASAIDKTIHFWNIFTGQYLNAIKVPNGCRSIAWSPDGRYLASCSLNPSINVWDMRTGQYLLSISMHSGWVNSIAWSPNGQFLASGSVAESVSSDSRGNAICLWDTQTRSIIRTFTTNYSVYSVAWSPDSKLLFTGSNDHTIRIWEVQTASQLRTLEGHTGVVTSISSSNDGHLLASKSFDGTVCLWHTDTWDMLATLRKPNSNSWFSGLSFHPLEPILATLDKEDTVIRIWNLNITTLLKTTPSTSPFHYINAKVVLVGESGVGKTGLSLVLTGQPFIPTESTHGRHIWTMDSKKIEYRDGQIETHETLLWDLAGQPGYHLIHQLYLNEAALTIVVFDAHNETEPLAGIEYWVHALDMAKRLQSNAKQKVKKFLVAARIDRSGKSVSSERINQLKQDLGFDGYFETSAKEGWGIKELIDAIRESIDWEDLPKVTSTDLFQRIKAFLLVEKEEGRLMSTSDDLYRAFLKSEKISKEIIDLHAQFETCVGRVESTGFIKRLSFGNLVLLQPEMLDAYASALILSVKDEPDGLGCISEIKAKMGNFRMPVDERLKDSEQERFLLIAMIEDLLRREIVLREDSFLIFPSQSTREYPTLDEPYGKAMLFYFEGSVPNIYATLTVRLSNCGLFSIKEIWKNAITYTASAGGTCGLFLRYSNDGRGELSLFYDDNVSDQTRFHFEEYVNIHLQRRANLGRVRQRRILVCPECREPFTDSQVKHRLQRGFDKIRCTVCGEQISIPNLQERPKQLPQSVIEVMDRAADAQRKLATAASIIQGKVATADFDVFVCYNTKDKNNVKHVAEQLKTLGLLPWLDDWELRPGLRWQSLLEQQIEHIKSAAVFVGKDGIGPWQEMELEAILREFVKRSRPVIPILLPDFPLHKEPSLPLFLRGLTWIDFRKQEPDPMKQLMWGITGMRSLY